MTTTARSLVLMVLPFLLLLQKTTRAWTTTSSSAAAAARRCSSRLFVASFKTHASSEFVTHVIAEAEAATVQEAIAANLINRDWVVNDYSDDDIIPTNKVPLSPRQLLQLGAVWFLPHDHDPQNGQKPQRLSLDHASQVLQEEDYLRIHHTPRRFPRVYEYNWTSWKRKKNNNETTTGVVVAQGDGFWVIDKPQNIPVHPTVDNVLENVAEQIRHSLNNNESEPYVSTPQRLDQNTSGLFVVARSKAFAGYFAKLLRTKTDNLLKDYNNNEGRQQQQQRQEGAIQKGYKCLVCLMVNDDDDDSSFAARYNQLQSYDILQHYLVPSIRAPKVFSPTQGNSSWADSLLRVKRVGEAVPLVGSAASEQLAIQLFGSSMPSNCLGVVELEVELLTGRTHQIRGQFAAEGYPLVGDAQYGGAVPVDDDDDDSTSDSATTGTKPDEHYTHSERLALQCSYLKFLDPDIVTTKRGDLDLRPSNRWNEYALDESWWTPLLEQYREEGSGDKTTSMEDLAKASSAAATTTLSSTDEKSSSDGVRSRSDLLPPRVSLSPGANKYILIKAVSKDLDDELWFVKSASPTECGGPYHADVARDVVDWLGAMGGGFTVTVTGGGRIDYDPSTNSAKVYGFSYGFGLGDHAKAASLIQEHSDIQATYDNDKSLY